MKKIISVILAAVLVLSLAAPCAFAVDFTEADIPVIRISGDGDPIHDADNNKIFGMSDILGIFDSVEGGNLYESVANVLQPFLIDGLLTGNYDKYYDALQKEISELFASGLLDNNGEASNGSGISQARKDYMQDCMTRDKANYRGNYSLDDYWFWYDWRLDPIKTADDFNEYVKAVKEVTHSEKVGIMASCLGSSVVLAYFDKYGFDDVCGVGFNVGVVNGSEILSETISGKFHIDGNAINRFILDCDALGLFSLNSFLKATIDLLAKSGAVGYVTDFMKETIYYTVVEGVTSALALSTFYTWPNYWTGVTTEDYDTAMKYVFGEEGSKKRTEYAGLIEKLENYDVTIRQRIPEIMQMIKDSGINVGVVSKYGLQMPPMCESNDILGDQIVSAERSSFGATVSTIYDTLSDEYIAQKVAEGNGKYISPDKQIDASTCLFPDSTWFIKGGRHSNWTVEECNLLFDVVTADRQLTIDDFNWTQYMIYDIEQSAVLPMTDENCDTYYWKANYEEDHPADDSAKLTVFIKSFIRWFIELIKLLSEKIKLG